MEVMPKRISWWENRAAMDQSPHVWTAPVDTAFAPSDPAPTARASAASQWPPRDWREFARPFLDGGVPGHLTLLDAEGFPIPIGVRAAAMTDTGFDLKSATGFWPAKNSFTMKHLYLAEWDIST